MNFATDMAILCTELAAHAILTACVGRRRSALRRRWDGRAVTPTPELSELDPRLVGRIRELTTLDRLLYDEARRRFDVMLREEADADPQGMEAGPPVG